MSGWVKICGLASGADVTGTVEAGPDFLGFVFWPRSPRAVTAAQVADWTRGGLPGGMRKVGVFVDQPLDEVLGIIETAGLDVVQLHGQQDGALVKSLPRPCWKAVHLDRPGGELPGGLAALLVDSGTVAMPGGTGVRVDTERAAAFVRAQKCKVLLAGGLKADTVADAIRRVRPAGVDVSSGVERAPGQKDLDAVRAFVSAARKAFAGESQGRDAEDELRCAT